MTRIRTCGASLVLAALCFPLLAQAVAPAGSCGADIDLVATGAPTGFKSVPATADGSMLAARGPTARTEGTERGGPPGPVTQEAQWIRTTDTPVAEPGLLALLVAGFLGMWAVARRRNHSS